jgi:hypothetical protein
MLLLATKFALLLFVFGETKRQMGLEKEWSLWLHENAAYNTCAENVQ